MKSSKSSPRARFQPDFFDFLCAGNLKAEPEGWKQQWFQRTPHCCLLLTTTCFDFALSLTPAVSDVKEKKRTEIEGSSSCLDCRRGRSKQSFYTCWKARAMSRAFSPGSRRRSLQGEGDGTEEVAAPLRDEGTTSENNTMHLEWVISWRARWNPPGGLDHAVDLCDNWVTCPSHPLNSNLRCLSSSLSRSISLASTMLGCIFRSLAMFSDGCKSTPCSVTMAEQKKARSVVRIISSNQRNPRNPNLVKSGLIEHAHLLLVLVKVQKFECQTQVEPVF